MTPPVPGRFRAFLMCTCVRNGALYYLGFVLGCAAGSDLTGATLVQGAVFWSVVSIFVEGANRLSDRVEDRVNRPERTYLCELVGFDRLRRATLGCFAYVLVHAGVWVAVRPSVWLAAFLAISIAVAGGYSYLPGSAPSLKRRRLLSPLLLTTPTVGPFLVAWYSDTSRGLGSLAGEPLAFLGCAFLVLVVAGGAKDVTDVRGDALIGYRSLWVDLARRHASVVVATAAVPAVAVLVLALAGPLPGRAALAAPAVLGGLVLLGMRGRASLRSSGAGGVAVRIVSSNLQLLLVALLGLLAFWSTALLAVVAATTVFWFTATRWLYWTNFVPPADAPPAMAMATR